MRCHCKTSEAPLAVAARHLSKTYWFYEKEAGLSGSVKALFKGRKTFIRAVQDIDFHLHTGEVVGFLGPNGAGKTTTLKMLSGILYPTTGEARVLGYRPFDRKPEMLRQIALVMGNRQQLWWDLPAWDSFVVLRELYDVPKKDFDARVEFL